MPPPRKLDGFSYDFDHGRYECTRCGMFFNHHYVEDAQVDVLALHLQRHLELEALKFPSFSSFPPLKKTVDAITATEMLKRWDAIFSPPRKIIKPLDFAKAYTPEPKKETTMDAYNFIIVRPTAPNACFHTQAEAEIAMKLGQFGPDAKLYQLKTVVKATRETKFTLEKVR